MLTEVKYTGLPARVLQSLFPEIDHTQVPLYADDTRAACSRFEFDRYWFRIVHPFCDFANMPVMVHEYAHMATLVACGFGVMDRAPEYRLEAAAILAEQALAQRFPEYTRPVYERFNIQATADVRTLLANAMRATVAPTLLTAIKMVAEGRHG